MERDCESELSKLNIEQNACIYHFGASVIHGQRSNILRLLYSSLSPILIIEDLIYRLFFIVSYNLGQFNLPHTFEANGTLVISNIRASLWLLCSKPSVVNQKTPVVWEGNGFQIGGSILEIVSHAT